VLGPASSDTLVRGTMTAEVVTVAAGHHHRTLHAGNTERRIPPAAQGGQVTGIVSIGDLVKAVIEEQQVELE